MRFPCARGRREYLRNEPQDSQSHVGKRSEAGQAARRAAPRQAAMRRGALALIAEHRARTWPVCYYCTIDNSILFSRIMIRENHIYDFPAIITRYYMF